MEGLVLLLIVGLLLIEGRRKALSTEKRGRRILPPKEAPERASPFCPSRGCTSRGHVRANTVLTSPKRRNLSELRKPVQAIAKSAELHSATSQTVTIVKPAGMERSRTQRVRAILFG